LPPRHAGHWSRPSRKLDHLKSHVFNGFYQTDILVVARSADASGHRTDLQQIFACRSEKVLCLCAVFNHDWTWMFSITTGMQLPAASRARWVGRVIAADAGEAVEAVDYRTDVKKLIAVRRYEIT
jgi:hypothetical protein